MFKQRKTAGVVAFGADKRLVGTLQRACVLVAALSAPHRVRVTCLDAKTTIGRLWKLKIERQDQEKARNGALCVFFVR